MNFIMTTKEVMEEYGVDTSYVRTFSTGQSIKHFELSDPHWVTMKDDARVTFWAEDALTAYIEFVLGE